MANHSINPEPLNPNGQRKWWVMLGVGLGVLMFTLDTSIVNIALPTLVQVLQTSFSTIQWVVLSYLLVVTAFVLAAARFGDLWGKKQLYVWGLIVFTISSLLCGLASSAGWLIAFRALQGAGAVMISALGAAIVTEAFPPSERGQALGIIGAVVSLGIALGPTVGGLLIGLSGWRLIFLVNVPIGIFATLVVVRNVPKGNRASQGGRFDWVGAIVMALTLVCFALGMTNGQDYGFTNSGTIASSAIAAVGLFSFIWLEQCIRAPMLDLSLFSSVPFSLSLLTAMSVYCAIAGLWFITPFFLELVLRYPTQKVGLLLAVSPILGGIIAPFAGKLSDRLGNRLISLVGLTALTLGFLSMSTLTAQTTELGYMVRVAPIGIGSGLFQSPNNSAILESVLPERLGIASGLLSLSRTLGQTTGLPLLAAVFTVLTLSQGSAADVTQASAEALVFGVQITFRVAAGIILAGAVLVLFLWQKEGKREARQNL